MSEENQTDQASPEAPVRPPEGTPTPADLSPPGPEEQLAALEAEKNDMRERMLRIAAEFENYKKRTRKELSDAEAKGKESVLRDVLEVMDNMERATAFDEKADVKAVQQGVSLVLRLFQQKLERHDVRPFEAKGEPFDPRLHDAVSQVPSADVPPGSVLGQLQRGYRLGEKLLRPALVIVALAPKTEAAPVEAAKDDGQPS